MELRRVAEDKEKSVRVALREAKEVGEARLQECRQIEAHRCGMRGFVAWFIRMCVRIQCTNKHMIHIQYMYGFCVFLSFFGMYNSAWY